MADFCNIDWKDFNLDIEYVAGIPQSTNTEHSYGQVALCRLRYWRDAAFPQDSTNDGLWIQALQNSHAGSGHQGRDERRVTDVLLDRERKDFYRSATAVLVHNLAWYPDFGSRLSGFLSLRLDNLNKPSQRRVTAQNIIHSISHSRYSEEGKAAAMVIQQIMVNNPFHYVKWENRAISRHNESRGCDKLLSGVGFSQTVIEMVAGRHEHPICCACNFAPEIWDCPERLAETIVFPQYSLRNTVLENLDQYLATHKRHEWSIP